MQKKGIEDVRKSKCFTLWDLVPYAVVLAVAVALMLAFLLPKKENMTGFYVEYGDQEILSYDFGTDEFVIKDAYSDCVTVEGVEGGYHVEISTSDGYNAFFADVHNKTVRMTEADCSFSQDCTYMPAIEKSGDSIICVPHKLKIIAQGNDVGSPVTG